jgi:hypothetical protein
VHEKSSAGHFPELEPVSSIEARPAGTSAVPGQLLQTGMEHGAAISDDRLEEVAAELATARS